MRPPGIILLVCGGREYADELTAEIALNAVWKKHGIALLVQGGQKKMRGNKYVGADFIAKTWAVVRGIQTATFDANWDALGNGAGPTRNEAMSEFLAIEAGVAFPGGTGTEGMCRILEGKGVKVWRVPEGWRP